MNNHGFEHFSPSHFPSNSPFETWTIVHEGQKIKSAQKICTSSGWPEMHANWTWPLWFQNYGSFLLVFKNGKISLQTMDYSPWGLKIELAQKFHASRGWLEMHANQIWWAWYLRFRRFHSFSKLTKFPFRTMDYTIDPWFKREIWLFWRQVKNEQNLWNQRGHTNQNWLAFISQPPLLHEFFELILEMNQFWMVYPVSSQLVTVRQRNRHREHRQRVREKTVENV